MTKNGLSSRGTRELVFKKKEPIVMNKKQIILQLAITALLIIATLALEAQPGGGGGGQGQGGPPPGSGAVPIDGGAILLAIGAAAYGRKKLIK